MPGLAPGPVQIRRRVDVHEKEVRVPEAPQLLPGVLNPIDPFQERVHGQYPPVEGRPYSWQQCAGVGGAERVGSAPESRDYRRNAGRFEALEKIPHQAPGQKRHVTGGDENVIEARGGEAGFDAGEGPQSTGSFVRYVLGSVQPNAATPGDKNFVAAAGERVLYMFDQGQSIYLDGELLAPHPTATATGKDHARSLAAQETALAVAPSLKPRIFWRIILTRSRLPALPERRARRFASARSTAAWCNLRATTHVPSLPVKSSLR